MGFAWASANVRKFGMPEVWDYPPPSPRHRRPSRRPWQALARFADRTAAAVAATPRRVKTLVTAGPALTDHRRAF
jgi:hypothetical protein